MHLIKFYVKMQVKEIEKNNKFYSPIECAVPPVNKPVDLKNPTPMPQSHWSRPPHSPLTPILYQSLNLVVQAFASAATPLPLLEEAAAGMS